MSVCGGGTVQKVRVSFVSVSAEVFIAKTIALETGGTFAVALHAPHFKQLLAAHTHPPPTVSVCGRRDRSAPFDPCAVRLWRCASVWWLAQLAKEGETEGARVQLVKMGFPNKDTAPGWCACHNKWCPSG